MFHWRGVETLCKDVVLRHEIWVAKTSFDVIRKDILRWRFICFVVRLQPIGLEGADITITDETGDYTYISDRYYVD